MFGQTGANLVITMLHEIIVYFSGTDISEIDLSNANEFSDILIAKCKRRERLSGYLKGRMGEVSPNLSTLLGEQVRR